MGRTRSGATLSQRRREAFEMYTKGYSPGEVAEELSVSYNTACRYRDKYEDRIREQAVANPNLLNEYLNNTVRALEELDMIRRRAWDRYDMAATDQQRATFLNIALKAQSDRAKLFNLFGVKQDYFMHVQNVHNFQQKIYSFMSKELCPNCRTKLENYITGELTEYVGKEMPLIEAKVLEDEDV